MTKIKTEYTVFFIFYESGTMYGSSDSEVIQAAAKQVLMLMESETLKNWEKRPMMDYKIFRGKKQILHIVF